MIWKFDPNRRNFSKSKKYWTFEEMGCEIVSQPLEISDNTIREGTYYIRRNGFYELFEYIADQNIWVRFTNTQPKSYVNLTQWNLFPQLPDKEYQKLREVWRFLSPQWRKNYLAYKHFLEVRDVVRRVRMIRFKAIGK